MKFRAGVLGLVLLAISVALVASGSTLAQAETRVRASNFPTAVRVSDFAPSAAFSQLGNGQSYYGHASVPVLAAEAAPAAEEPFAQLAGLRSEVGAGEGDTLARLDVNGTSYYGMNGQGLYDRPAGVSFQTMRHAEGNAFGQAAYNGAWGGRGALYVDRAPCGFCSSSMAGLARSIGLEGLDVYTPEGLFGSYSADIDRFLLAGA